MTNSARGGTRDADGVRVRSFEHLDKPARLKRGAYGRDANGRFWVCTPDGQKGVLCFQKIEEHEDGTITTSPIIGIDWYGYIERGKWISLGAADRNQP